MLATEAYPLGISDSGDFLVVIRKDVFLKYDTYYPETLNTFQQLGKIETPREVTVLFKQQIVSAVKNILFCSRLTLQTHRHLKAKNCVNLCLNSLFTKVNFKISFDLSFAYFKIICSPYESLTHIDAVTQILATSLLQIKQWNVTNNNCQGYYPVL